MKTANPWTYTVSGLPRYRPDGTTQIAYTVRETPVQDYTPSTAGPVSGSVNGETGHVTAADFTNTLVTVSISGSKTWVDESDKYGTRPDDITLTVLADSAALSPQPDIHWVESGDTWTYTITGLPRYHKGTTTDIDYSVVETAVAGYTPATDTTVTGSVDGPTRNVTGANFTNTLVTLSIAGSKVWDDQENRYARRPADIALTVLADGTALSPQPEIHWDKPNSSDTWTYTISGLPRYRKGTSAPILYTVRETKISNYLLPADAPGSVNPTTGDVTGADFTNTLEAVSISGSKTWRDESDKYGTRPGDITLTVLADGAAMSPQPDIHWSKPGGSDTWTYSVNGLPRYRPDGTTQIAYTLRETPAQGYLPSPADPVAGSVDGETGHVRAADFTNTLVSVSISGSKAWADESNQYGTRPDAITLTVLADGAEMSPQPDIQWVKSGDTWTYTITGLPRHPKGAATNITYSVRETAVAGYAPKADTTVTGIVDDNTRHVTEANFTNTLETVHISGSKTWDDQSNRYGIRPTGIKLTVLANGVAMAPQPQVHWDKPNGSDTWTYTITGLPRYRKGTSERVAYSVRETAVPGYTPETDTTVTGIVDGDTHDVSGADFTNSLAAVSISGFKTWVDESDKYGTRPADIALVVLADSVPMTPQPQIHWTKTADPWAYSITGLPRYRSDSAAQIVYTVQEIPAVGYLPSSTGPVAGTVDGGTGHVTGADFTNTLETVSLSGTKTWEDESNKYHTRPQNISLTVLADGVEMPSQPQGNWNKSASANTWTYSIAGLPRYRKGTTTDIAYSVVEDAMGGYALTTDAPARGEVDELTGNVTGADFTNTLETISLSGSKTWGDHANRYGVRPGEITLTVLANGAALSPQPQIHWAATGDTWTYSVAGLPRYATGTDSPITYSLRETPVDYYRLQAQSGGTVDPDTGDVTGMLLHNKLLGRLEIHNTTPNAATGARNAGGFVAVDATPSKRDMDPYQDEKILVRWRPDAYWQNNATLTVRYLEHGASEESGWKSVTVPLNNLSALKAIPFFANAELRMDGETVTLRLASDSGDMPYLTQVLVGFQPSLAVENTTQQNLGGRVEIRTQSAVSDGRYPNATAYGEADPGHIVDMENLQISIPTGVAGSVQQNTHAVRIKPDSNGRFTVTLPLEIAGVTQQVPVTGQVRVLKRDSAGNPVKISITLDSLPASLDIGIPFMPAPKDNGVPQTGDPILWAVALLLLSGAAIVLLRKKKR